MPISEKVFFLIKHLQENMSKALKIDASKLPYQIMCLMTLDDFEKPLLPKTLY